MNRPLTPINEARQQVLEHLVPITEIELCSLRLARGRVLAQAQTAGVDVPAHDNSAMDGYAISTAGLGAGDILPVSQVIAAGHVGQPLQAGTAARIFTGAVIPDGADAVIIQENTRPSGSSVELLEIPAAGANIRLRGHDIAGGTQILESGHRLRPQDLGLLSSLGISEVPVFRPLKVALLNTGDEVIAPGQSLGPGQIYDSNSFTLQGLLEGIGCEVQHLGIIADTLESTEAALAQAAREADCIISTGGVSVGDEDHVRSAVENLGGLSLWKLAIKPGKPFAFGNVQGIPFFGLPGNPVAVFVTFTMLVRTCLQKMQGARWQIPFSYPVPTGFALKGNRSREEFIRVRLVNNGKGEACLALFPDQGSSILSSLSWADGLALVPVEADIKEGDLLPYFSFEDLL